MGFGGIDVKSSRVGRGAAAVAVVAVAALGMSGCAAFGGVDGGAVAEGAERPENALPPGVLPPNDPPQPGDARLGSDGHYDYSAPDFVLKNPCDTEYFQRAMELGWEVPEIGTKRRDEPASSTCSMVNDSTGLPLVAFDSSVTGLSTQGYSVELDETGGQPLIIVKGNAILGESCFAGAETQVGVLGAMSGTGGFSQFTSIDDACKEAIETIIPILGGN